MYRDENGIIMRHENVPRSNPETVKNPPEKPVKPCSKLLVTSRKTPISSPDSRSEQAYLEQGIFHVVNADNSRSTHAQNTP
jgi:hypothetical protein